MFYSVRVFSIYIILFLLTNSYAWAGLVSEHAPIGVMADHRHKKGEWMTSYRYMRMDMPNNYTGANEITPAQVQSDFIVSPLKMSMEMHMIGLMYGVNDDVTAMIMVPYITKDMEHRRRTDSRQFSTRSQGIGDITLSGLFSLQNLTHQPIHFNFGLSLPSGSIDRTDETLLGKGRNLPYPMQLGSGTFAVLPGITYLDHNGTWSWGFQEASSIQLGKNSRKYKIGERYELTSWIAKTWNEQASTSLRVKAGIWGNINGADQRLNPALVSTADPNNQGGERIDLFLGLNLLGTNGPAKDHRLAFEFGFPVYQSLDGPQLGAGFQGIFGWQKAF